MGLITYVNDAARGALANSDLPPPVGSINVKHHYGADGTFTTPTVVYKSAGFDPEHYDWLWAQAL